MDLIVESKGVEISVLGSFERCIEINHNTSHSTNGCCGSTIRAVVGWTLRSVVRKDTGGRLVVVMGVEMWLLLFWDQLDP